MFYYKRMLSEFLELPKWFHQPKKRIESQWSREMNNTAERELTHCGIPRSELGALRLDATERVLAMTVLHWFLGTETAGPPIKNAKEHATPIAMKDSISMMIVQSFS